MKRRAVGTSERSRWTISASIFRRESARKLSRSSRVFKNRSRNCSTSRALRLLMSNWNLRLQAIRVGFETPLVGNGPKTFAPGPQSNKPFLDRLQQFFALHSEDV